MSVHNDLTCKNQTLRTAFNQLKKLRPNCTQMRIVREYIVLFRGRSKLISQTTTTRNVPLLDEKEWISRKQIQSTRECNRWSGWRRDCSGFWVTVEVLRWAWYIYFHALIWRWRYMPFFPLAAKKPDFFQTQNPIPKTHNTKKSLKPKRSRELQKSEQEIWHRKTRFCNQNFRWVHPTLMLFVYGLFLRSAEYTWVPQKVSSVAV